MRPAASLAALLAMALLLALSTASSSRAQTQPASISVYAVEVESHGAGDRILIFTDKPARHRIATVNPKLLLLRIEDASLDSTVSPQILPRTPGVTRRIRNYEARAGTQREVRVEITLGAEAQPKVSAQGNLISVELSTALQPREETLELNIQHMDLSELVKLVSEATGESFILGDQLKGRVTLHSPAELTVDEARELLNAALLLNGLATSPGPEGKQKIVPMQESGAYAPWSVEKLDPESEGIVATMIHLKAAEAATVATAVSQTTGATMLVLAYPRTNSIIFAGTENRIYKALEILASLDEAAQIEVITRRLRHRSASFAADILREAFGAREAGFEPVQVFVDERTNSVVLAAAPERMPEVRAYLREIDQPEEGEGNIRVYRARFADPEKLAEILNTLDDSLQGGSPAAARRSAGATLERALANREYSIVVDAPTRSLVIRADPSTHALLDDLLEQLDVRPPRVSVDILILEVASSDSLDLAIEGLAPVVVPKNEGDLTIVIKSDPTGGGFQREGVLGRFSRAPLFLDVNGVEVSVPRDTYVIDADATSVTSRLVMNPSLLMLSGEENTLNVGNNIPVPVSSAATDGSNSLTTRQSIERYDTGVTVRVTPTLRAADDIHLDLFLELSELAPSLAGDATRVGPTIVQRKIETKINIREGEVAVIGVFQQPTTLTNESGIPFLKDIPFLGFLFRATRDIDMERKLIMAVEARGFRDPTEDIEYTIRKRLGFERSVARSKGIHARPGAPWGLRMATRRSRRSAEAIADFLRTEDHEVEIAEWESMGVRYFDVYFVGLTSLEEASQLSLETRRAGWYSELVVLPAPEDHDESL